MEAIEMGGLEVLTIVFIVMKLIGVINWSWWLVLLPSLIEGALVILIAAFLFPSRRSVRR
jgi:hypothetical protein